MYRTLRTLPLLALLTAGSALAAPQTWAIDASHTEVGFKVRHMMVSWTKGSFEKFEGTVTLDDKDITKGPLIDVTIDAASIDTDDDKRDGHLRSPDFFDVKKHPKLTFKAKRVKRAKAKDRFQVLGDLTIRGVTKPVTLDVEGFTTEVKDPWGNARLGGTATATINRKDFGLNWNKALETGGVLVGEEVKIALDIELIKQTPKQAKK